MKETDKMQIYRVQQFFPLKFIEKDQLRSSTRLKAKTGNLNEDMNSGLLLSEGKTHTLPLETTLV